MGTKCADCSVGRSCWLWKSRQTSQCQYSSSYTVTHFIFICPYLSIYVCVCVLTLSLCVCVYTCVCVYVCVLCVCALTHTTQDTLSMLQYTHHGRCQVFGVSLAATLPCQSPPHSPETLKGCSGISCLQWVPPVKQGGILCIDFVCYTNIQTCAHKSKRQTYPGGAIHTDQLHWRNSNVLRVQDMYDTIDFCITHACSHSADQSMIYTHTFQYHRRVYITCTYRHIVYTVGKISI